MPSEKPLVHFVADQALIDNVDDFRFKHRFKSRAAAMKFLLKWALAQEPRPEESDRGDD